MKGPSKTETAQLADFPVLSLAQIFVPRTQQEFADAHAQIVACGAVGFDTESKPTFRVGDVSDGPHVVQFAMADKAFIFQVHRAEGRAALLDLLQSKEVLKAGFGLKSDRGQVQAKLGVQLGALLDLDSLFRKQGYTGNMGVRAAIGLVLQQSFHKSKRVTTSNWSLRELSPQQLEYAANDAYAAFKVLEWARTTRPDLLDAAMV